MRLGEDWRLLPDPALRSLVERLEWLRAMDVTIGGDAGLQIMERAGVKPGDEPDFARILLREPSVEVGNTFLERGIAATLAEASQTLSRIRGLNQSKKAPIAALNEPAQPFLSADGPRVIAWGTWAAHYQRLLLDLLERTKYHYQHNLGLKDRAERFATNSRAQFGRLTLFPILEACWEAEIEKPSSQPLDIALDLILKRPELVTADYFRGFEQKTVKQASNRRLPPHTSWFTTGSVRGTNFDFEVRRIGLHWDRAAFTRVRALSPKDYDVVWADLFNRNRPPPTLSEAERAFGERLEYDFRALRDVAKLAEESDPATYLRLRRRMCDIDAGECLVLAGDYVDHNDEAGAVAAYEKAIAEAPNRVRVSHSCLWLMSYYLRHGRRDRAKEIAELAADVGSAGGYLTMSSFLEQTGDPAGAEQQLLDERERYPDKEPDTSLLGFYYRMVHERHVTSYEAKFRKALAEVFPQGLESVELSSLHEPPTDGLQYTSESATLHRNGLEKSDVVVAWDGWRVRNRGQYEAAREFGQDLDFRLIVWRKDAYLQVGVHSQSRRFDVDLASYTARSRPTPGVHRAS